MNNERTSYCPLSSGCEFYKVWTKRVKGRGRADVISETSGLYSCMVIKDIVSPLFGRDLNEARNKISGGLKNFVGCSYVELLNKVLEKKHNE